MKGSAPAYGQNAIVPAKDLKGHLPVRFAAKAPLTTIVWSARREPDAPAAWTQFAKIASLPKRSKEIRSRFLTVVPTDAKIIRTSKPAIPSLTVVAADRGFAVLEDMFGNITGSAVRERTMTECEIKVLNYVQFGCGGPDSIISCLRPVYHSLIERRFIGTHYMLTDTGRRALEDAEVSQPSP